MTDLTKFDIDTQKGLLDTLTRLQQGYKREPNCGVCSHIDCREQLALFELLYEEWPKYSGDIGYPVPVPDGSSPIDAYTEAGYDDTMWRGEYGALRLELVEFCINAIKENM